MIEGDSAFRLKPHCCNLKASHSKRVAPGTRSAPARPYAETVYPCRPYPSAPSLRALQDTGFSIQEALLTIRQSGDQNIVRGRNSTRETVGDRAGHPAHAMALDVAVTGTSERAGSATKIDGWRRCCRRQVAFVFPIRGPRCVVSTPEQRRD